MFNAGNVIIIIKNVYWLLNFLHCTATTFLSSAYGNKAIAMLCFHGLYNSLVFSCKHHNFPLYIATTSRLLKFCGFLVSKGSRCCCGVFLLCGLPAVIKLCPTLPSCTSYPCTANAAILSIPVLVIH